jgi:hypothetical protein
MFVQTSECSNLCFERLNLILKIRVFFGIFILLFHNMELIDSKASERKFQLMFVCSNYQRLIVLLNNRDNCSQQNFLLLLKKMYVYTMLNGSSVKVIIRDE